MKKIILLASLILSINAFSQKLVKTYWDYRKTKLQSEYYTDAYGTKAGAFKGYSEYGGILMQGSFQDGAPIGKWTENYLDGKLHFIKIYSTPGYTTLDVKDGKIISYYENGKTIKYEKNFKNGELDGDFKTYDENGTLIEEGKYVNGVFERMGECKRKYDEEQKKHAEEQAKINQQKEEATTKKNAEDYKNYLAEADKAIAANEYSKARSLYTSASNLLDKEQYPKDKIKEIDLMVQKIAEIKVEATQQTIKIDTMYNTFKRQYVVYKQSVWLVDATTQKPIVKETHPKGEHLYKKSDAIIQPLINEYRSTSDIESKITKGNYIVTILDKMISLSNTDTKDIDKQIKRVATTEEVKNILGIQ